jgi:UDP-N-acetylmuramate-alanine ligase
MSGDRIINVGSGIYNESIHGNSTNIQGNHINIGQDLSQAAAQIQQFLNQLQTEGATSEEAQKEVARDLATQTKNDPNTRSKLAKLSQYVGDAAANGLISEAVVEVVKTALRLAGLPL